MNAHTHTLLMPPPYYGGLDYGVCDKKPVSKSIKMSEEELSLCSKNLWM